MGRKVRRARDERKRVPYKVRQGRQRRRRRGVDGKKYSPPEVSARILQKLNRAAENYLGDT